MELNLKTNKQTKICIKFPFEISYITIYKKKNNNNKVEEELKSPITNIKQIKTKKGVLPLVMHNFLYFILFFCGFNPSPI